MAVVIRFNTILVRKASLATRYPGGLDAYRSAYLADASQYYEDPHLVAHTSMHAFHGVEERLAANHLVCRPGDAASDWCAADQAHAVGMHCPWLRTRVVGAMPVCWLASEPPGHVVDFKNRRFLERTSTAGCDSCGGMLGAAAAAMAVDAREWRDGPLAFVDPMGHASAGGYIVVCGACGVGRAFAERGVRLPG